MNAKSVQNLKLINHLHEKVNLMIIFHITKDSVLFRLCSSLLPTPAIWAQDP